MFSFIKNIFIRYGLTIIFIGSLFIIAYSVYVDLKISTANRKTVLYNQEIINDIKEKIEHNTLMIEEIKKQIEME